jgi:predicted permease
VLRLGILPVIYLLVAKYGPFSLELKRVLVVQAGMPTAMTSVILARLYGGHPKTAVQIVIGTTIAGLFLIPLWLRAGMAWVLG